MKAKNQKLRTYSEFSQVCSFKGNPEVWSEFKLTCKMRGVDICYVEDGLMRAWIAGQKAESTILKPVVVNLEMQYVVQRPRRMKKKPDPYYEIKSQTWPPNCPQADVFIKSTKLVGCLDARDWIPLAECWACSINKKQYPNF